MAKQSGLRYAGQPGRSSAIGNEIRGDGVLPIERDETILVPPPAPGAAMGVRGETGPTGRLQPVRLQVERLDTEPGPSPSRLQDTVPRRPEKRETGIAPVDPRSFIKPPSYPEVRQFVAGDGRASAPAELHGRDHSLGKETTDSDAAEPHAQHHGRDAAAKPVEFKRPDRPAGVDNEEPPFFARTAAGLENGGKAAEIRSILFQEVQEWVAASPERAWSEDVDPDWAAGAATTTPTPRRGAIGTITRDGSPGSEHARVGPLEQNFELSIGAVNVIIEEAIQPALPVPVRQKSDRMAAQVAGPRSTRLSRNYI